jgi:hypothetical protein
VGSNELSNTTATHLLVARTCNIMIVFGACHRSTDGGTKPALLRPHSGLTTSIGCNFFLHSRPDSKCRGSRLEYLARKERTPPPRTAPGSQAYGYCRVLGGGVFF